MLLLSDFHSALAQAQAQAQAQYSWVKESRNKKRLTIRMATIPHFFLLPFLLIFSLARLNVSAELIYEDGYSVKTVLDGNRLGINPHSVAVQPGSSDLLVLDLTNSALYSIALPISEESVAERFSGNGVSGFSDGDRTLATYNKPKSLAVDLKGNVYVADKNNLAVRKISASGVTTIAGGNSEKPGHADGPGRSASFSTDFELVFIPDMCSLLVSDHGNKLVRQINLKPEDCAGSSPSGAKCVADKTCPHGMRISAMWGLGLGLSCLLGLAVGFMARPYIMSNELLDPQAISKTWNHCLMNLGRQIQMHLFGIRNAVANSAVPTIIRRPVVMGISHLSLIFGMKNVSTRIVHKEGVSLLDCDHDSNRTECVKSQLYFDQMRELMTSDVSFEQVYEGGCTGVRVPDRQGGIDDLLQANLLKFAEGTRDVSFSERTLFHPLTL